MRPYRKLVPYGLVAAFLLAAIAYLRTGKGVGPRPGTTGSPEAGADGSRPTEVSPHITQQWRMYVAYLRKLKAGGHMARQATQELRHVAPFDLGSRVESWVDWLELGAWWDEPAGRPPPRSARAIAGTMEHEWATLVTGNANDAGDTVSGTTVGSALHAVTSFPDDCRNWLYLGRLLENDQQPEQAAKVYAEGLRVYRPGQLKGASRRSYQDLIRALLATGEARLESEWKTWTGECANAIYLWETLGDVLWPRDRRRYELLLRGYLNDAQLGGLSAYFLGALYESGQTTMVGGKRVKIQGTGDTTQAMEAWRKGVHVDGNMIFSRWALATSLLRQGLPEAAAPHSTIEPLSLELPYLSGNLNSSLLDAPIERISDHFDSMCTQIFALLEAGRHRDAVNRLREFRHSYPGARWLPVEMALLNGKDVDAQCFEDVRGRLLATPDLDDWCEAAGELSSDACAPHFSDWLAESAIRWSTSPSLDALRFARSLWCSRRHRDREALDLLGMVMDDDGVVGRRSSDAWEIITRPLWRARLGEAIPEALQNAAVALGNSFCARNGSLYWRALVEGDVAKAAQIAEDLFRNNAGEPLWGLTQVWAARALGQADRAAAWGQRLRMSQRVQGRNFWLLTQLKEPVR